MDDFLSGLTDALSAIGAEIAQLVVYIFNILVTVLQFVWAVIQAIAAFLLTAVKDIGSFFAHLWDNFFKGIFGALLKGIVKFGQWLHAIFAPVVKFLRKISGYIDRIYNHYVRPVLRYLQIVRVFLTLLRALGVKWAAQLDSILGKIQSDIQRAFLLVKQYINTFVDLLNILADPTNLLRRPTTLLSLRRIWNAFIRQYTGVPPGFFVPSPSNLAPLGIGSLPANFDPRNPVQNPPASYYLAFDGGVPDFSSLTPGDTIPDVSVDDVSATDYFNEDAYAAPDCLDIATCRDQVVQGALSVLNNG